MQALRKSEHAAGADDVSANAGDATIVVARAVKEADAAPSLPQMAAISGQSPLAIVREFASLAFGPGGLSFTDYVRLRLFDNAFWDGADKRQVIGAKRNMDIALKVNWRHRQYGLMLDKIASRSYLAAYGLPTIPTLAIWAPELRNDASWLLSTRQELVEFLMRDEVYPLFGKPVGGVQSLGSIAIRRRISDTALEQPNGESVEIERFVADIEENYRNGYLFQPMVTPHGDIVALCGERLGTARMVTITGENGPELLRAAWKIPSAQNMVDNYWRAGNMLARLDLTTGEVKKVISGDGLSLVDVVQHPDTGAVLVGAGLPNWELMKQTALEGARLMNQVGLIGWDMASTVDGPVIVEMNVTPDLGLCQLADARGMLDDKFSTFAAFQKRLEREQKSGRK